MQTFLPYPDFDQCAKVLDYRRLGKQRVETLQIMKTLTTGRGWIHHPATLMWRGYERALLAYQEAITYEWWYNRRFNDTCWNKTRDLYENFVDGKYGKREMPHWFGNWDFHLSHQSNLVNKDPNFYGPLFPEVPIGLPYIWPSGKE